MIPLIQRLTKVYVHCFLDVRKTIRKQNPDTLEALIMKVCQALSKSYSHVMLFDGNSRFRTDFLSSKSIKAPGQSEI